MEGVVDSKSPNFACAYSRPHQCVRGPTGYPSITRGPMRILVRGLLPPPSLQLFPLKWLLALHGVHSKMNLLLSVSNPGRPPARSRERGLTIGEWGQRGIHHGSGGRCPKDWQVLHGCAEVRNRLPRARFRKSGHRGVPPGFHHPKISGDAGRFKPSRALAFGAEPSLVPSQKGFWSTKGSEIQKWEQNFAYRPPKLHERPRRFIKRHKVSDA